MKGELIDKRDEIKEEVWIMFNEFIFGYYRLMLQAGEQGLVLAPFKGDLLRDDKFKMLLRSSCCISKRQECSGGCLVKNNCPYAFMYGEVEAGPWSHRNFGPLPSPVAWHPPTEKKTEYVPGEKLYFHLVLAGRGISFLEKYVFALKELGKEGPSSGGHFTLNSVVALCPFRGKEQQIYEDGDEKLTPESLTINGELLQGWVEGQLTRKQFRILFLTPTFLQVKEKHLEEPLFSVLVRELFRKVSALYYFFHRNKEMELNYRTFLEKADKIKIVSDHTRFLTGEIRGGAYGNAQGLLGEVGYGEPDPVFLPLLKLGEYINVGSNAQFGFGRYRLKL